MSTLNVQEVNSTTASHGSLTYSSYAVPSGDNKILRVGVHIEQGTVTVSTLTHNGVAMTYRGRVALSITTVEYWDLQLGSTTPTGNIVATYSGNVNISAMSIATETDLAQQAPEATQSASSSSSPINTAITTITDDAVIVDVFTDNAGTIGITQGPDQVQDVATSIATAPTMGYAASHRVAGTAGSYTLGWTGQSRLVHFLAAYEAAGAVGNPWYYYAQQ